MVREKKATSEPATKKDIIRSKNTVKMRMVVAPGGINKKVKREYANIATE
jgi:hypothetical protein